MKKFIALLLCGILTATALTGCGSSSAGGENGEVIVYNWGEYIDPDTITMFEKETGIKVVYDCLLYTSSISFSLLSSKIF